MCYLSAPQPTLGLSWGDSLIHPMLITVFLQFLTWRSLGPSSQGPSLSRTLCSITSTSLSNDNYQMFFRFVNCVCSRCYYIKNSAKKRYKIFQHASPIARQNIPKCFLSPRTTWNILQSARIKKSYKTHRCQTEIKFAWPQKRT